MVSISKLYLNLRKKLLFVSVLPIEKVRSHHMTLGREVILTGFHEFCAIFRRDTNLKLQFLPYSSPFFYLAFDNKLKASKANSALFFQKQQAAWSKIHRYALRSHYECKQMSWEKNDEEEKMCMYFSYQAGVSPEGGLEVGQTL